MFVVGVSRDSIHTSILSCSVGVFVVGVSRDSAADRAGIKQVSGGMWQQQRLAGGEQSGRAGEWTGEQSLGVQLSLGVNNSEQIG